MKTEDILNLDFREQQSKNIIQKVLVKIKPLSKYSGEQVPIEAIEKVVAVLVKKYEVNPQWMMILHDPGSEVIYSIGIKHGVTHEWICTVYGTCLYEVWSKLAIKMYSLVKSGEVKQREKTK